MAMKKDTTTWYTVCTGPSITTELTLYWLHEELEGDWSLEEREAGFTFLFEYDHDAVLFALRWL